MKKTYLGLALEEVLEECGLEHMNREIGQAFKDAFMKNYNELLTNDASVKISGIEENLKESPIGHANEFSCYTLMAKQIKYKGKIEFLNRKPNASTCIEAFSGHTKRKIDKAPKFSARKGVKQMSSLARTASEYKKSKRRIEE